MTAQRAAIHPKTRLGLVALKVADMNAQIHFYEDVLGMRLHWREGKRAGLGAGGADLLVLSEHPDFRRYERAAGLYHFALLYPGQRELARAVERLFSLRYHNFPIDHVMTKTTYLEDPEGNGIELYAESPEDGSFAIENGGFVTRRADGSLSSGREALDLETLFAHLRPGDDPAAPMAAEARLGHMHLHVSHLDEAVDFYERVIGFDLKGVSHPLQAAFLSAGGYHHHIGLNTWQGAGAPMPPEDALGLDYFTILLPDEQALRDTAERIHAGGAAAQESEEGMRLTDPSGHQVLLTTPMK